VPLITKANGLSTSRQVSTNKQRIQAEILEAGSKDWGLRSRQKRKRPMNLQSEISSALKDAMREKNETKLASLRSVLTAIKNKEKEVRRSLEDPEVISLISTQIKQRKESIDHYRKAGREDLAKAEESEMHILQGYMPEELSADEMSQALDEVISEVGAVSIKDMGKVMKAAMAKLAGRADGRVINEMVREKLSQ
jgi:uncharacterized protein YqeY